MQSDSTQEFGVVPQGMVKLQPGDVVRVLGRIQMVIRTSDSNATVSAPSKARTITDRVMEATKTFTPPPSRDNISTTLDKELVLARLGPAGVAHFLKTRTVPGFEEQQTTPTEGEHSMAAKTKKARKGDAKNNETKDAKAASSGRLGGFKIGDQTFSTCSVLRRLGMAKVGVKHAQAIMDAAGIKAAAATVAINIGAGSRGKGSMAQLTKEQVEELKSSAKDPEAK